MHNFEEAGKTADQLIAAEVAVQDKMWGDANERAKADRGELLSAAVAQLTFVHDRDVIGGIAEESALALAKARYYPSDWDGFRSYGSTVANLAVAGAYIRNEMKRLIAAGEDTTRTKRGEAYPGRNTPYMSSEQAAKA